jgi:hypothetical protein
MRDFNICRFQYICRGAWNELSKGIERPTTVAKGFTPICIPIPPSTKSHCPPTNKTNQTNKPQKHLREVKMELD